MHAALVSAIALTGLAVGTARVAIAADIAPRFEPIEFAGRMNIFTCRPDRHGGFLNAGTFPEAGANFFDGVPFVLGQPGSHGGTGYGWNATYARGDGPRLLEIETDLHGVDTVYTLMNSFWGERRGRSSIAMEFVGSDGAFARFEFVAGVDVRDYNSPHEPRGDFVETVFANGHGQFIDKQTIDLPSDFLDEDLSIIRVIDTGNNEDRHDEFSRAWLIGLTAELAPQGTEAPAPRRLLGLKAQEFLDAGDLQVAQVRSGDRAAVESVVRNASFEDQSADVRELQGILARNTINAQAEAQARASHHRQTPTHTRTQTVTTRQHDTRPARSHGNTGRRTINIGGHTFEMIVVQPDAQVATHRAHTPRPTHTQTAAQRMLTRQLDRIRAEREAATRPDARQELAMQLDAERQRREREAAQGS